MKVYVNTTSASWFTLVGFHSGEKRIGCRFKDLGLTSDPFHATSFSPVLPEKDPPRWLLAIRRRKNKIFSNAVFLDRSFFRCNLWKPQDFVLLTF